MPKPVLVSAFNKLRVEEQKDPRVRRLAWRLDEAWNLKHSISTDDLTQEWAELMQDVLDEFELRLFTSKYKPHRRWTLKMRTKRFADDSFDTLPDIEIDTAADFPVLSDITFNPHGTVTYLPCLLGSLSTSLVRLEGNARCAMCTRNPIRAPFDGCLTVPGLFRGSCLNCAWGNTYAICDLHQPESSVSAQRAEYVTTSLVAGNDPWIPLDTDFIPTYIPKLDDAFTPPARAFQTSTDVFQATPNWQMQMQLNRAPAESEGCERARIIVDFDYDRTASGREMQEEIQRLLPEVVQNWGHVASSAKFMVER